MLQIRAFVALAALCVAGAASAQQPPAEEPGWAKGRPKTDTAMKMAPVPAFPIPTAADQLPTKKFKLPPGFKVETWASGVLDAREIARGRQGHDLRQHAVRRQQGLRDSRATASASPRSSSTSCRWPTGIEFDSKGNLYVAHEHEDHALRQRRGQARQARASRKVIYDKLPGGGDHSWKYLRIKDDKLYYNIGAPCNICDPGEYAKIYRMNLDGTGIETIASGVRNTVGFDFDPKTGDLWFTDNGRDWLSEELPNDELNVVTQPGKQHFGYPYCHQGNIPDPEFGWGKSCDDYVKPAALLGPHAGSLGLKFYTGKMFPAKYQGAMFIATPRPVEPHQEVHRRVRRLARRQGRREGRGVHDRLRREQQLPRPAGRLPGDEGRLDARQRRPCRSDLSHQLRQVTK